MPKPIINQTVLMSGADFFQVEELNPYSFKDNQPNINLAIDEHNSIKQAFIDSGIDVHQVQAPPHCQDAIYTANWALCYKGKVLLSSLPNMRHAEESYAKQYLQALGYETVPSPLKFSGQGDALPCGDLLFVGSVYRTAPEMHPFLESFFDCQVVGLQTIPYTDENGREIINSVTGWPDSYFYDLDLALSIITPDLIAWCPEAFTLDSRRKIEALPIQKITVSFEEASKGFACNLVSTGETVIMSAHAPELKAKLEAEGFKTITPEIKELAKGGGYIRCCSLTLF